MSQNASVTIATPVRASEASLSGRHVAAILLLALFARALYWTKRPPDLSLYLEPWFNHILHWGPVEAFAHPFSNYTPAYLYLLALGSVAHGALDTITIIKLISIAGTLFLTFALTDLLKSAGADSRWALIVLMLPSVAINDTLLAQCDAFWAGSCIFGLAAMLRGQTLRSMLWCGIGIAFKAQAAFMAPVIIGAMIGRRAPLWQWALPALVFLASLVPPWLLGWPGSRLLAVYLDQAALDQIAGRLANPWILGTIFAEDVARSQFLLGYAAASAAAVTIAALAARGWRDPRLLILLAALSGTALPFLLPKMLERYYFLGDVMTLALAASLNNRIASFTVRAVQLASFLSHLSYLYFFDRPYPALAGAVCAGAGIMAMCRLAAPSFASLLDSLRSAVAERTTVAFAPFREPAAIRLPLSRPSPGHAPSSSGYSASATCRCSPAAAPSAAGHSRSSCACAHNRSGQALRSSCEG